MVLNDLISILKALLNFEYIYSDFLKTFLGVMIF